MIVTLQGEKLDGKPFSTYRIGGPLEEAFQPETLDEAVEILTSLRPRILAGEPFTVLGWGSNTLIASGGITGMTLILRKLNFIEALNDTTFHFGAGVHLAKAASVALEHGLSGGEFMIGIPGTVGGAVRMNAGALGQQTADILKRAMVYNLETGALETWHAERLEYRYRHSALDPSRQLVLAADFEFKPGNKAEIQRVMDENMQFRKTHHPTEPNGGSVFRNPVGGRETVGKMLDELGAKDWTEGGVRISPRHANFIVNLGEGTSTDVLLLMRRMKCAIREHYGVDVFPENVFIGNATEEEQGLWAELTAS